MLSNVGIQILIVELTIKLKDIVYLARLQWCTKWLVVQFIWYNLIAPLQIRVVI